MIKDKPVEFVYVSIDTDTTIAKNVIYRYKLGGIFTFVDGVWNAKEIGLYGVQSLPAYFLIDKNGNFATQNTPSPLQYPQLIQEIDKLVKD